MEQSELKALVTLLDDPDEEIFDQVRSKLISVGRDAIPALENAWENSFPSENSSGLGLFQNRIEDLIQFIQFETILNELREWAAGVERKVIDGAILVTKYQYPDVDTEKIKRQIQLIKNDIELELDHGLSAFQKITIVNRVLFDVHGFSGNTKNYHAPQNSFINNVLESKKGNPLSLSILYVTLCRELKLPVYGINLPKHFIATYKDDQNDIQFYINPFSKGTIFERADINSFLKQLKIEPKRSYYQPCDNIEMVQRILINLDYSYHKLGYQDKIDDIKEMMQALEDGNNE